MGKKSYNQGIQGGTQKWNYLRDGRSLCSTGLPREVSVLGTLLCQCTSWRCCERLDLASVNCFEDSFTAFAPFMMGDLRAHPTTLPCVQQFLTQNGVTPVPHPPDSLSLAQSDFIFVSPMKKALKGQHFADVEEVKGQEKAEALGGFKINDFKTVLSRGKRCLNRCVASNGEHFEGD